MGSLPRNVCADNEYNQNNRSLLGEQSSMHKLICRFEATTKGKKTRCLYRHLRVMLKLIHLFQLYASQIDKTILVNGIVLLTMIALCCFPCVTLLMVVPEMSEVPLR